MSYQELARPERKEVIRLTPEQEVRGSIVRLAQQLLDLRIREPRATPDFIIMHGYMSAPALKNGRSPKKEGKGMPMPKAETYILDSTATVSMLFEETPVSLYLNIANVLYPQPEDSIAVEFKRMGVNQTYILVDGPKLLDGTPAPAETALTLTGEGQTLVDLIRQA